MYLFKDKDAKLAYGFYLKAFHEEPAKKKASDVLEVILRDSGPRGFEYKYRCVTEADIAEAILTMYREGVFSKEELSIIIEVDMDGFVATDLLYDMVVRFLYEHVAKNVDVFEDSFFRRVFDTTRFLGGRKLAVSPVGYQEWIDDISIDATPKDVVKHMGFSKEQAKRVIVLPIHDSTYRMYVVTDLDGLKNKFSKRRVYCKFSGMSYCRNLNGQKEGCVHQIMYDKRSQFDIAWTYSLLPNSTTPERPWQR
jgi:hypothetical protein